MLLLRNCFFGLDASAIDILEPIRYLSATVYTLSGVGKSESVLCIMARAIRSEFPPHARPNLLTLNLLRFHQSSARATRLARRLCRWWLLDVIRSLLVLRGIHCNRHVGLFVFQRVGVLNGPDLHASAPLLADVLVPSFPFF